jgi:hypothetical protein
MQKPLIAALALAFAASAAAQQPPTPTPPPSPAPSPAQTTAPIPLAGAPAPVAPTPPGQPKPFKEVLKDSQEVAGLFKLHRKDEKVWIEIAPEQFDKPFFFSMNIPKSVGERGLYGGQMVGPWNSVSVGYHIVEWRKIGTQVQLIAKNTEFFAAEGTPQARFVEQSYSDSLLASAPAASMPHPESKAVLIEANALLFADIPGYSTGLERAFRMPFALDARNTSFTKVNNSETLTSLQVSAHFAVPKISPPPLTPAPVPNPPPPAATPDPRSLFVGFQYNFMKLPQQPMPARAADPRIGHFTTSRINYTEDLTAKPRSYFVTRWRLEKKDPAAAVSEPVEPIVYWLDKNIPEKYRKSVSEGILEWNKAFEKAGFRNAIVVKQQTESDDFDTMDSRHASVRWFTGADVGFAIGPSHIDPRTGEILDADIGMSDVFARGARRAVAEDFSRPVDGEIARGIQLGDPMFAQRGFLPCNYMEQSAHEMHFAFDVLEARGIDMDSPEAEAVAQAYVKDVVMHEIGHTLGFRHNFRASTIYTSKQINDAEFTRKNGLTGSVMDYTPFNIAMKGETQAEYVMSTIGPYDYWAIEYAYKPIEAANEKAELARIAARSSEPLLAYATDEDAGYGNVRIGIDPDANRFDLGSDPLEYYRKRMKLSRELWDRLQTMKLKPGESYERLTRSLQSGFNALTRVAPLAAKYVGGVRHVRDFAGTDRALYEPTPVARQREALTMITNDLFHVDSFKFRPEFVSHLGIDHFDRPRNPDISIANAVLNLQKSVLDVLLSDPVATRLLDSQEKVSDRTRLLKLSDLYDTLQSAIWAELKTGRDISPMRRNLQREHLRRIVNMMLRTSPTTPADARSLAREDAIEIQGQIRAALAKGGQSKETRAHLRETLDTLTETLKAPMQRASA